MASNYASSTRQRGRATSISFSLSNHSRQSSELIATGAYHRGAAQRPPAQLKGFKSVRVDASTREASFSGATMFTDDLARSRVAESVEREAPKRGRSGGSSLPFTRITPDAVGAEGAAATAQALRRLNTSEDHGVLSKGAKKKRTHYDQDDEVLLQMRLPVSAVIDNIRYHHDRAAFWSEMLWHLPFLILFTLMLLLGNADSLEVFISGDSVRRMSELNLYRLTAIQARIMLEAFRIDSEQHGNSASTPFVPGGSVRFPWMYTNYDEERNAWTPQPNASSAVDEQESRIAEVYRNPNIVNYWSIRTKRDLMRWLTDSFVPLYWNCESADFAEPWLSTRGGSSRMVGSARLTSQRRLAGSAMQRCRRKSLGGMVACQASDSGAVSQPPLTPSVICHTPNPSLSTETLFRFAPETKGYTARIPFTASCNDVLRTLSLIETEKQRIIWNNSTAYVGMTQLWSTYEMDAPSTDSCSSFLFHRSVSLLQLEYVVYATATNTFMYVRMSFDFASTGTVIVPHLAIRVAPVFGWQTHFTKLAFSIVLSMYWLYYARHIISHHTVRYRRTMSVKRKSQRTALARFIVLVQQLCDAWTLLLFCALIFTAAYLITLWVSWARLGSFSRLRYDGRMEYPNDIARYCQRNGPLMTRLLAAAVFFTYCHTLRYISILGSCWVMLESLYAATTRVLSAAAVWMLAAVGMSIAAMLLFGTQMSQFSRFDHAYNSMMLLLVDRNKYMFTGMGDGNSINGYDSTAPSTRGGLLRANEVTVVDGKRNEMRTRSLPMTELFLDAFYFIFIVIFSGWLIAMLMESYQQTLSRRTRTDHMSISLKYRALRRSFSRAYWMESLRHALWTRSRASLYAEMEAALRSAYLGGAGDAGRGMGVRGYDASSRSVTYLGVLWRFPRSLQAEMGPAHLRCWWQSCADSIAESHSNDVTWFTQQWRRYWETGREGLEGWLQRVVPPEVELESKAVDVGLLLEELPTHIVKYVERSTSRTPRAD